MAGTPTDIAAGRVRADLAKADAPDPLVRQDWFERSAERGDYAVTALRNLSARMRGIAQATVTQAAAERVGTDVVSSAAGSAPARQASPSVSPWGGAADQAAQAYRSSGSSPGRLRPRRSRRRTLSRRA